jgi:cyclopropane-fatty-acyl-phospholipid synthase
MESELERKTVRVTIFNQTYSLGGAASEPGEVEELAHSVDELMTGIAQRAGNMDAQRIAVIRDAFLEGRDREAIKFHYDVSNRFYELQLGPSLVYSCATFSGDDESLEVAHSLTRRGRCRRHVSL